MDDELFLFFCNKIILIEYSKNYLIESYVHYLELICFLVVHRLDYVL